MNILFVENREKTYFWSQVAQRLQQSGHQISWLVQNPAYRPDFGRSFVIPFPKPSELSAELDPALAKIASTDRNRNYFGGNVAHYPYYKAKIAEVLEQLQPDIVFGEATLFHELLCIMLCRDLGILYLHPATCRYPTGRFSFYQYDELKPLFGSGERFSDDAAIACIDQIINRTVTLDYMRRSPRSIALQKWSNKFRILGSNLAGERYNTPSPLAKWKLTRSQKAHQRAWEKIAEPLTSSPGRFIVLYPLHLQPEAALDLFGNPYRDQPALLQDLQAAVDRETVIHVKPNPKSYYELLGDMVPTVHAQDRLIPLPHTTSMAAAMAAADLVVTVTGTVAIEAALTEKPVVTLMRSLHNEAAGCVYLPNPCDLGNIVRQVREGTFPKSSDEDKITLLSRLVATSYQGQVADPLNAPWCIHPDNLSAVHAAFSSVLSQLESAQERTFV